MPVDSASELWVCFFFSFRLKNLNFMLQTFSFCDAHFSDGITFKRYLDVAYMQATSICYVNIWKKLEWNVYEFACGRNEITTGAYSNEIWIYIIRIKWAAHRLSVKHAFSNRIDSCATLFWVIPFHFDWVFAHFSCISVESLFASLWTLGRTRNREKIKNTHTRGIISCAQMMCTMLYSTLLIYIFARRLADSNRFETISNHMEMEPISSALIGFHCAACRKLILWDCAAPTQLFIYRNGNRIGLFI